MVVEQSKEEACKKALVSSPESGKEEIQYGEWMVVHRNWRGRHGVRRE